MYVKDHVTNICIAILTFCFVSMVHSVQPIMSCIQGASVGFGSLIAAFSACKILDLIVEHLIFNKSYAQTQKEELDELLLTIKAERQMAENERARADADERYERERMKREQQELEKFEKMMQLYELKKEQEQEEMNQQLLKEQEDAEREELEKQALEQVLIDEHERLARLSVERRVKMHHDAMALQRTEHF